MADKLYINLVLNVTREKSDKVILQIILKSHALVHTKRSNTSLKLDCVPTIVRCRLRMLV